MPGHRARLARRAVHHPTHRASEAPTDWPGLERLRRHPWLDFKGWLALGIWLLLVLVNELSTLVPSPEHQWLLSRIAYQAAVVAVAVFLLTAVRPLTGAWRALPVLQLVIGLGLLAWGRGPPGFVSGPLWFGFNLLFIAGLGLNTAYLAWRRASLKGWMVLAMAISALGMMFNDLQLANNGPIDVTVAHHFYLAAVLVLWLASTERLATRPTTQEPARAQERLAQDLHDGVGAHLSGLISALEHGSPTERATAASLRECQMELKMLVDGVDEDASVVSLLASLRYRIEPLLRTARIRMHWNLADEQVLEQVRGTPAREVLRVAQESLANVVRHSGAADVTVTLCHVKATSSLLLEVVDNGAGMAVDRLAIERETSLAGGGRGKGLPGMEARARRLGGLLSVEAVAGQGTRVRLVAPMRRLLQPAAASTT